jgi:hypothetical protein
VGTARLGLGEGLDQGEAERQGLARPRLGLAADVASGQGVGDGQGLDRKRLDDAPVRQRGGEVRGDAERLERGVDGELLAIVGEAGRPDVLQPKAAEGER